MYKKIIKQTNKKMDFYFFSNFRVPQFLKKEHKRAQ